MTLNVEKPSKMRKEVRRKQARKKSKIFRGILFKTLL